MSFLRPFLADRQQISNVDQSDLLETETQDQEEDVHIADDSYSPISTPTGSSTSRPLSSASTRSQMSAQKRSNSKQMKTTLTSAEVLQEYLTERSSRKKTSETQNTPDAITKFFECMAETVKTFSPELQIEVKSKIFVIVNDAERKNINFSNITSTNSQKATFSDQPFPSTQIHQQHWVTTPQAQFHQQQQQHHLIHQPYHTPIHNHNLNHSYHISHIRTNIQQNLLLFYHLPQMSQKILVITTMIMNDTTYT